MSGGPLVVIVTSKGSPCRSYPGNVFPSPQVQLRLIPKLLIDRFRLRIGTRTQVRTGTIQPWRIWYGRRKRVDYPLRYESTTSNPSNTYDVEVNPLNEIEI
jgi:hypothetical protein